MTIPVPSSAPYSPSRCPCQPIVSISGNFPMFATWEIWSQGKRERASGSSPDPTWAIVLSPNRSLLKKIFYEAFWNYFRRRTVLSIASVNASASVAISRTPIELIFRSCLRNGVRIDPKYIRRDGSYFQLPLHMPIILKSTLFSDAPKSWFLKLALFSAASKNRFLEVHRNKAVFKNRSCTKKFEFFQTSSAGERPKSKLYI
jgi:hypothetical protein